MNWAKIEEITYSECDNPHELLGPHKQGSKMLVQAFFPGAEKVTIHWKKTGQVGEAFLADVPMELADEEGYFAALHLMNMWWNMERQKSVKPTE